MKKLFIATAAVAMISGTAFAADELTPAQMDGVTAGTGSVNYSSSIYDRYTTIKVYKDVFSTIDSAVYALGNAAFADATADAEGTDTFSETLTQTLAVQGHGSWSASSSESGTANHYYNYGYAP